MNRLNYRVKFECAVWKWNILLNNSLVLIWVIRSPHFIKTWNMCTSQRISKLLIDFHIWLGFRYTRKKLVSGLWDQKNSKVSGFPCEYCTKSFDLKSRRTRHIRDVHFKLKPFRCEICSRAFAQKSTLSTHIRSVHLNFNKSWRGEQTFFLDWGDKRWFL